MEADFSLVGRCGLYCGACAIYRAQRDDPERRTRLAKRFNCLEEEVCCEGCGALTETCWGSGCKLVLCLNERGYRYCYECPQYGADTCEKFARLAAGYREDGVDLRANLAVIQDGRVGEWLEESARRYSCPECRNPLSLTAAVCPRCGRAIAR